MERFNRARTVVEWGLQLQGALSVWDRAKSDHPEAFGLVCDEHRDRVFGQALRLTRASYDAEERYGAILAEALDLANVPRPLGSVLNFVALRWNLLGLSGQ